MMKGADPRTSRRTTAARLATALLVVAFLIAGPAGPAAAGEELVHPRSGVTITVLAEVPQSAPALLLLFEGGPGVLSPGYQGFAHRVFKLLAQQGIGAALVDAPARSNGYRGGLDPLFRESRTHIRDIDVVVAHLKREYGLPVWVLGVSNGTRSAAAYALKRSGRIAGMVLVSSSTTPPNGTPIEELPPLKAVDVPLLAIAHRNDECQGSPPSGAARIAEAATASPSAVAMFFTGGLNTGPMPCGVHTHHLFYGIEDQVAAAISWFIKTRSRRDLRLTTNQAQ